MSTGHAEDRDRRVSWMRAGVAFVSLAVAAWYVALGAAAPWDFETSYHAASAWRAGLDPYDLSDLSTTAGRPVQLPFLYPPLMLLVFAPFTLVPLAGAALAWLAIKGVLLAVLLWIWHRDFLPETPADVLLPVALFGFDAAALWDLRTGNVAIVECVLLWSAFSAYLGRKWVLAASGIAVAGAIKLVPIGFLALILLGPGPLRPRLRAAAWGGLLVLALLLVPIQDTEAWFRAVVNAASLDRPTGAVNPGALSLIDAVMDTFRLGPVIRAWAAPALYLTYGAAVVAACRSIVRDVARSGSRREWVILIALLWIVLSPRPMVYGYVMATAPAIFVLERCSRGWRTAGFACLLFPALIRFLPGRPPGWLGSVSFWLALFLLVLFIREWRTRHPTADVRS